MLTQQKMHNRVEDIKNKICPDEIEEAVAFLYGQVMKLEEENSNLREKIERLKWTLQEQD